MPGNTFGHIFRLTTFGESHGKAIGGIIDGCPAGLEIDIDLIQKELDRRKPGQSGITSQRKESDKVEFLSGIFEGKTTGTPIGFMVRNEDTKPGDYEHLKDKFRPSHADYTYHAKYGHRDHRGGGRTSARETVSRVVAGAVARMILKRFDINIYAYTSQVGDIKLDKYYNDLDLTRIDDNIIRCPDKETAEKMMKLTEQVKKEGDTIGGVVTGVVQNVPAGLGEPVFDKLHADLGKAMLSIPAVKGFEYGSGFEGAKMKGSEHNDSMNISPSSSSSLRMRGEAYPRPLPKGGETLSTGSQDLPHEKYSKSSGEGNSKLKVSFKTNYSGGIQGGISNGEDIYFRVAFKPVSTIMKRQMTVNTKGEEVEIEGTGRHDPCVMPRAVPVVEAMAALVIVDHFMRNKTVKLI
ncbi:MAG: chorismate synthase [Bacteroidota bacterium]